MNKFEQLEGGPPVERTSGLPPVSRMHHDLPPGAEDMDLTLFGEEQYGLTQPGTESSDGVSHREFTRMRTLRIHDEYEGITTTQIAIPASDKGYTPAQWDPTGENSHS